MGDDVEKIADLPDGTIEFDILSGIATHSSGTAPDLEIADELQAWFQARLAALNIDPQEIESAKLDVTFKTDRLKTSRKTLVSFDFECRSSVVTEDRCYEGTLVEKHTYHNRRSDA